MSNVSNFVIDRCFNTIWEFWPNKDKGSNAPYKAITVALKSGHKEDDLIKACRIYSHLVDGDDVQYIKRLNNFINENEWMDILEHYSLEALEKQREECIQVIQEWNKACRSHWHSVIGIDSRVPLARLALQNKSFKDNWKKSLDNAKNIFQYRFNDSDMRSKINLTFSWFTSVSPTKHTVLKILEGDYGKPTKETYKKITQIKTPSDEERKQANETFSKMFEDFKKGVVTDIGEEGADASRKEPDPYGFH